jgi:hypothetical protein
MGQDVNLLLNLTTFDAKKQDPRRYNLPTASEVGIIIKDASNTNANRDLIVEYRNGQLQRISELHSGYLPLRFPLLYPYGEPGWHTDIPFSGVNWQSQNDNRDDGDMAVRLDDDDDDDEERGCDDAEEDGDEARGTVYIQGFLFASCFINRHFRYVSLHSSTRMRWF